MRHAVLAAALVVTLAWSVPACADGQPGSFEVWVNTGLSTQSLGDWNARYDLLNSGLDFFNVEGEAHEFGAAIPVGVELSYRLTPGVSIGAAVTHQRASVHNRIDDTFGFIIEETPGTFSEVANLSLVQMTGVLGAEIPGARGTFVWVNFGWGFAKAELNSRFEGATDNSFDFNAFQEFDGTAMVGGIGVGLRRELGGRSLVRASIGYQMADISELDSPDGPPLNFLGEPMQTDFGGFKVSIGVGAVLTKVK